MKFRFALLVAALALALSISAFAYSEEPAQDTAAPAQEETTSEDSAPFVLLRVYEGQFADVKDGDWFASPVVSAYEYGLLNGRSESSFAPNGNVTIAELLTIAARLRAIYTTGSDAVIPAAKENEAWYAPYVSYLKSQNLLDNSFEGFYLLPASRAQMAGIFAFAVPEEWYTEPNASLVTSAYASREYIADVTDKTPYRSEILLMYRRGLLSGMDAKGSFYPDRSVSRAEIAALLTRVVKPETRLTLTWTVAPYHSVKNATLASLVKAPASTSLPTSAKDTAAIDGLVRNMLARRAHDHAKLLQGPHHRHRQRADAGVHLLRQDILRADVQRRLLPLVFDGQGRTHVFVHRLYRQNARIVPRQGARRRDQGPRLPLGERHAELRHEPV